MIYSFFAGFYDMIYSFFPSMMCKPSKSVRQATSDHGRNRKTSPVYLCDTAASPLAGRDHMISMRPNIGGPDIISDRPSLTDDSVKQETKHKNRNVNRTKTEDRQSATDDISFIYAAIISTEMRS